LIQPTKTYKLILLMRFQHKLRRFMSDSTRFIRSFNLHWQQS